MWACDDDYKDYLAHYGVVGMRWGIRRYQPYSYTGKRKDGKTGKEVGAAAKLGRSAKSVGEDVVKAAKKAVKNGSAKVKKAAVKGAKSAAKAIREEGPGVAKAVGKGALTAGKLAGKGAIGAVKLTAKGIQNHRDKKRDKIRQKLIAEGSMEQIMAARGKYLSEIDVGQAITRMRNDVAMRDIRTAESQRSVKRGKEAIDNMVNLAKTGMSVYKMYQDVQSTISEAKDKPKVSKDQRKAMNEALKKLDADYIEKNKEFYSDDELLRGSKRRTYLDKILGKNDENKNRKKNNGGGEDDD